MASQKPDLDVIIIGAGVSGINAGYRVHEQCPNKSYAILEARNAIGGTWDLFKYPGIRSDSDLHTFGFPWRPWSSSNTIADAASIKAYVKDCAATYGIDKNIRYGHSLKAAEWSTAAKKWTLTAEAGGKEVKLTTSFLVFATGYYDYDEPLAVKIPGIEKFEGKIIHPQFWPEDLDYTNKNIVIIGSGATAITLLPNLADKAEHVTMLQRSPSYIMALPQVDPLGELLKMFLPKAWAYQLIRLKFLILPFLFFQFCRAYPGLARKILTRRARRELPKDYPMDPNFSPKYNPWEQRLCVCPNGDFFKSLGSGKASIVTAHIDKVTEKSIVLKDSGEVLRPDIIVTATGLKVKLIGGVKVTVDGVQQRPGEKFIWKGALIQDVPNAAVVIGYTNASWTLGADATSQLITRLINTLDKKGQSFVTPKVDTSNAMKPKPILNLSSTYITEAEGVLPKAGSRAPWLPRSAYLADIKEARNGNIEQELEWV